MQTPPGLTILPTDGPKFAAYKAELASQVTPDTPWFKNFVLMFAATGSLEHCAHVLNVPKGLLGRAMQLPEFDVLLRESVREHSSEASIKMLRGTRIDCILRLIQLRDRPGTKDETVVKICTYLLAMNFGTKKDGLGKTEGDEMVDLLSRTNGSLMDGLDNDIMRLMRASPAFAGTAQRLTDVGKQETGWQGNAPGATEDASASSLS